MTLPAYLNRSCNRFQDAARPAQFTATIIEFAAASKMTRGRLSNRRGSEGSFFACPPCLW
jgi:hypothetical protein